MKQFNRLYKVFPEQLFVIDLPASHKFCLLNSINPPFALFEISIDPQSTI
jgi:hypothetical protein